MHMHKRFQGKVAVIMGGASGMGETCCHRGIAIHPAQVAPINDGFTPTETEVAFARRIIEAFAANPGSGTVGWNGQMLDIPHLKQAQHVLRQAGIAK